MKDDDDNLPQRSSFKGKEGEKSVDNPVQKQIQKPVEKPVEKPAENHTELTRLSMGHPSSVVKVSARTTGTKTLVSQNRTSDIKPRVQEKPQAVQDNSRDDE